MTLAPDQDRIRPSEAWLGGVLDALGRPLDGGQPLAGAAPYWLQAPPVEAHRRRDLGPRLDLGVRALNLFTPCREGQRMGIFAGSGVGKSTLLAMLARHSDADALVLGLIGERGRELHGFLHQGLGPEGLRAQRGRGRDLGPARHAAPPRRLPHAHRGRGVARPGLRVLCLIDSVTRFAMALREIYLAAGEPPTSRAIRRACSPSCRAAGARRAGPGTGSITGLFTVLVEGDDLNDPVAMRCAPSSTATSCSTGASPRRAVPGDRRAALAVAQRAGCYRGDERPLVERARQLMRAHADMAELIQLGAYRAGSDPLIDEAIAVRPALEALLAQGVGERSTIDEDLARLAAALGPDRPAGSDWSGRATGGALTAGPSGPPGSRCGAPCRGSIDQAIDATRAC